MPVTLNLKKGIDLPVFQWLRFLPTNSSAGATLVTDLRGTHRFIYALLGASSFWRYDTITDSWQQLANPPSLSFGASVAMTFDPSQGTEGYIWLSAALTSSPYHMFAYYDVATNTWTSRAAVSGLSAAWGTSASLCHTCSTYNAAGNDDYLYLIGNNATTWYRYSIAGNSWATMAPAVPAATGAGCAVRWVYGYNTDRLYVVRGAATSTIYHYSIGGAAWTTLTYYPSTETFTTGSAAEYDSVNRIYIVKDATHRMYYYQLDEDKMYPAGTWPYTSGTAIVGGALVKVTTEDGANYLYYRRNTGAEFWRMLIGWF